MPQPRRRMPEVSKTARRDCCLRTMRPCSSQFYPSAPNARRKPRATTFPPLLSSTRREGKPRRYRATPLDSTARPMMRPPAHASHEPQDGALFPRDWLRRRVLFTAPADLDVFEIRLHSDAETNDLVVYTTNRRWVLDNRHQSAARRDLARLRGGSDITDALLDRVVHNAHRLKLKGPSRRKTES